MLKYIKVNDYTIKLKVSKQLIYKTFYSLKLIEIKTLKIYIKINLDNSFIKLLMLSINASIFFVQKSEGSFYLYIYYWKVNNFTFKNQYFLPLIK